MKRQPPILVRPEDEALSITGSMGAGFSFGCTEMNAIRLIVLCLMAVSSYGEGSNHKQYCIVGAGPGGTFWTSASNYD